LLFVLTEDIYSEIFLLEFANSYYFSNFCTKNSIFWDFFNSIL